MYDDAVLLTPAQVEAAAAKGHLPRLAERLVAERSWPSLGLLFSHAGGPTVTLDQLVTSAQAAHAALAALPESQSGRAAVHRELRGLRVMAAAAIVRRLARDPLTQPERHALRVAAEIYAFAGEAREAGHLFERIGDDEKAAETWEQLGDVDRLESCLERIDARRSSRLGTAEAVRRFEMLQASGERLAALEAWRSIKATPDGASLAAAAAELDRRLRRGHAVSLRISGGPPVRFARTPALLGRDAAVELPLRDPGVSRRHATLVSEGGHTVLEDAGSRAGTFVGGARIAGRVRLGGLGEVALGERCRLHHESVVAAPGVTELRGTTGLDRGFRAFVGPGALELAWAEPSAGGLTLDLAGPVPRLTSAPGLALRLAGRLVGPACELAAGDRFEWPGGTLEVE